MPALVKAGISEAFGTVRNFDQSWEMVNMQHATVVPVGEPGLRFVLQSRNAQALYAMSSGLFGLVVSELGNFAPGAVLPYSASLLQYGCFAVLSM